MVKDKSSRLGLDAFKILGITYAIRQLQATVKSREDQSWHGATDGNHGRALAHVARQLGMQARVYIHNASSPARVQAIADEGAQVTLVNGNYDDSVKLAAREANKNGWVIVADTAWEGYETIPRYIMAGYTMLLAEAAEQWAKPPDVVFVQAGVGGLAGAVAGWLLHTFGNDAPLLVCCEPVDAACVMESLRAGRPSL